jgi:hypothetical protein
VRFLGFFFFLTLDLVFGFAVLDDWTSGAGVTFPLATAASVAAESGAGGGVGAPWQSPAQGTGGVGSGKPPPTLASYTS